MQLFAFDVNNQPISCFQARKQIDYFCPECRGIVRLRGGLHRQNHFYHSEAVRACRQNGKSGEHLALQLHFLKILPKDECFLEYRMPNISRIADVVWLPQKIVFEIQCAFITSAEVEARNSDYASLGFEVIWILHDKRYNLPRLSSMEQFLYRKSHYFTNMQNNGKGMIYDQFSLVHRAVRLHRLPSLPIDLSFFNRLEKSPEPNHHHLIDAVIERIPHWPGYFRGDLIDISINSPLANQKYLAEAHKIENAFKADRNAGLLPNLLGLLQHYLFRPYKLFIRHLLERCSK